MKFSIKALMRVCSALVLGGSLLTVNGWAQTTKTQEGPNKAEGASPKADGMARINISFKLDPRLSGPTYGGERWVSPPIFAGAAGQDRVEARVAVIDAKGRSVKISPKWTPADADMVEVTPNEGSAVSIAVKRAGATTIALTVPGASRQLSVKAEHTGKALQVQISQ